MSIIAVDAYASGGVAVNEKEEMEKGDTVKEGVTAAPKLLDGEEKHIIADLARSVVLNAAVSWTGGKESLLALHKCMHDPTIQVTLLVVFRPPGADFLAHSIPLMHAQAKAIGLPVKECEINIRDNMDYKQAYAEVLRDLRNSDGVNVIITGDIGIQCSDSPTFMQDVCELVDSMDLYLPHWNIDRESILMELLNIGYEIIFTLVKAPWFGPEWIGRRLDLDALKEMKTFIGFDLCGER